MLTDDFNRYISLRRALGYKLERAASHLASFAAFATDKGDSHVRAQTAVAWAQMAPSPDTQYRRLRDLIRAAHFLRAEDLKHEIPPAHLFAASRARMVPYIYAPDELVRLLDAAADMQRQEQHPLRRQVYVMLFGLIAVTGLRISEALDLRLGDVLPDAVLRIRNTKFGKTRLVPLHPSVGKVLDQYRLLRQEFASTDDHLFLSARGQRIHYTVAHKAFRHMLRLAGVAPGRVRCPRIHDLRHSFATRVLETGGAGRDTIARHAVALMTYMGHSDLRYTYWYLQATPTLMGDAAAAAEALMVGGDQ